MAVAPANLVSSTITIDSLPDHVLTEVMLRVPTPAALVHAAAASKRLRGVIANREFLDDYRERHKSSPFLGLYIPREFVGLPSFQKADSMQSADDGDRDLDLQRAAAKAFSLGGLESHPEWRLLDCYNSRLLLAKGNESLEVYNPLSCERMLVRLPQDDILPHNFSACLLQGHGDDASSFRVVSVQHHRRGRDRMVRAVEYNSCTKSWKDHDWETLKNMDGTEQGELMHAGDLMFHKYNGTSLLLLDTRDMKFSVLPVPADNNWKHYAIGEMEDGVCCLASIDSVGIWNDSRLRVWKLDKLEWKLEKEMQVEQVLGKHACRRHSYYKVRRVTNGIACLSSSSHQLHFVVDLKTFYVKDKFEFKDLAAYPMQMPWPPAFSVATVSGEQSLSIGSHKNMSANLATDNASVVDETQNLVYTVMNPGSNDGNNDSRPDLRDGIAPQNCMPSNAPEDLGIQDPVAFVPTPTAAEECLEKKNDVPNDYDLEASILDLCVQFSDLMHPGVTKLHLERRESLVRLKQGARCPFAVSDRLHPKYCLEDSESPYIQEGKHNWGPIQVLLKEQKCFEDWDHSEGENPGISEMDNPSLGCLDVVTHGCSDVYGSHDSGPELRDDGALHNRVPSNALEDLGIQEPITTAPTPARSEECFEKEGNVPNDRDLELLIPVQDLSPWDEDSAEVQSNERLLSNAAEAKRGAQEDRRRRSNREPKPNSRVKGPDWTH